jgi:hypothetical protein
MKGNTITHATALTARKVGAASLIPKGASEFDMHEHVRNTMKAVKADGYYLLHNHPSGDPEASEGDKAMTLMMAREHPGMRGHVIINSNRFSTLTAEPDGFGDHDLKIQEHVRDFGPDKLLMASKPLPIIGRAINDAHDVALAAKSMQRPGVVTLIGTDRLNKVRVVTDVPSSMLGKSDTYLMALVRRLQRQSGSMNVHAVGSNADINSDPIVRAVKAGVLRDAAPEMGDSLRKSGVPGHNSGTLDAPTRQVGAPDPLADNYKGLEGRKVGYPVKIADTGQTATVTEDGAQAMRAHDARIAALKKLVECLA